MIDFDFDDIEDGFDDDSIHNDDNHQDDNHLPNEDVTNDDLNHTNTTLPGENPIPSMIDPEPDDNIIPRPSQEEGMPNEDDVPQGCRPGEGCWSSCIGGLNK